MIKQPASKGTKTRLAVLEGAARLFQRQGYAATSMNQIVSESGQPKGSLYFHFPGGKLEIAAAAALESSKTVAAQIEAVFTHATSPDEATTIICAAFANQLKASDYLEGCPISPLATSAGEEASSLRKLCADAYNDWLGTIAMGLQDYGITNERSAALASLILSSVEGAILLSQARHNTRALDLLPASLAPLFRNS